MDADPALRRHPGESDDAFVMPLENEPAIALTGSGTLDRHTRVDLLKQERAIARTFHGGPMWMYPAAAFAGYFAWLALFPLTMFYDFNLFAALVIASVLATGGYVTSHEAMHSNIARKGDKLRWLNEWTGKVSTIPIVFPFSMARLMHLEHHYHTNDPMKDPDYTDEAPNAVMAWYKTWYNRQPGVDGSIHHYKRILADMGTPEAAEALKDTMKLQLVFMAVLFAMAWSGYALEAAMVWWLPRHIGLSYIRFYLSWAPHHPREGKTGRYEQSHIFKSRLGHVMSMGMQTHFVHHLYPGIPNHKTLDAYHALKPVLKQRGVDCSAL
ncbi:fatty acid desaturase [Altererythrobacter aquiaggeris]|uniref:fatty acid desaturase n=1 Tax=Aestuarierythrobacter aquiaggeris TaxID=1898396 RepID=UPI0030159D1C